jgi:hypothetical protein
MTRLLGVLVGIGILVMASFTFQDSAIGWKDGHSDIGFWWAVITGLLTIAGVATIIGTWIHTQQTED